MFTNTRRGAFFHAEIWKHPLEELRLVHVCVNFPHPLSPCWVFPSLRSWARERNKELIVSIYLFSFVLNITKACHRKKYYICSHGVNFLQNSCWDLYLFTFSDSKCGAIFVLSCAEFPRTSRTSKNCLKNEQECVLSGLKTRGEAESFYNW